MSQPLISVFDMINKGHTVVFGATASYAEHDVTKKRIAIEWHGHNPVMCFEVIEAIDEDFEAPFLAAVSDSEEASPTGYSDDAPVFRRQAHL